MIRSNDDINKIEFNLDPISNYLSDEALLSSSTDLSHQNQNQQLQQVVTVVPIDKDAPSSDK